jgi:hypothetical protein
VEVHPPHKAIHSVNEFMVHMLAITLGLLIALGLEATVEWLHHRSLVREARENITEEMRENQRNLAAELKALPAEKTQLKTMLEVTANPQRTGSSNTTTPEFQWKVTRLSDAAWNTAGTSGALAHMQYAEARRYSQIYMMQQMFNGTMDKYVESREEMYAFLNRIGRPEKPSVAAFEKGEAAIEKGVILTESLREIGTELEAVYSEYLRMDANERALK